MPARFVSTSPPPSICRTQYVHLQSQASQIELLQRRLLEEQAHGTARRGDVEAARRQREEQIQQLLNEKEDIAREKVALETKLQGVPCRTDVCAASARAPYRGRTCCVSYLFPHQ